jgi:ankyrin repeat protein
MRIEGYSDPVKHLVKKALLFLFSGRPGIGLKGLCEAISLNEDSKTFEYDEIVDEEDLLQWCSSLVRITTIPMRQRPLVIEFAHFTVREYLGTLETRCFDHASAKLKDYAVSLKEGEELVAFSYMRCITVNNVKRLPSVGDITLVIKSLLMQRRRSELYCDAVVVWRSHITHRTGPTSKVWALLQELFQPCKTTAFCLWAIEYIFRCSHQLLGPEPDPDSSRQLCNETIYAILRPEFSTLHMAAAFGLHDICKELLEMGSDAELCSRFGTPLDCAVGGLGIFKKIGLLWNLHDQYVPSSARTQTVQLLIQATASRKSHIDTIYRSENIASFALRDESPFNQNLEVVMHLMKAGFDINITAQALKELRDRFRFNFKRRLRSPASSVEKELFSNFLEVLDRQETLNASVRLFHQEIRTFVHGIVPRGSLSALRDVPDEQVLGYIFSLIKIDHAAGMYELLTTSRCELVKSGGIDPNHPDFSALHLAVTHRSDYVLKSLLEFGLEARAGTRFGKTPVHLCGLKDNSQSLKTLLQYGGTTLDTDKFNKTVWHYAAEKNSVSVLEVLLSSSEREAGLKMLSYSRQSPICAAVSQSHLPSVRLLLQYCEAHEYWKHKESLHKVLRDPLFGEICERLFALGIFTNTAYGLCILTESLQEAIEEDDVDHCRKIYTLGFPREPDFDLQPRTPLTLAICHNAFNVVEYLLAKGVHVSTIVFHPETLQVCTALELALEQPHFNSYIPSILDKHIKEDGNFSHMESSLLSIPLTTGNSEGLTILLRELACISQLRNMFE